MEIALAAEKRGKDDSASKERRKQVEKTEATHPGFEIEDVAQLPRQGKRRSGCRDVDRQDGIRLGEHVRFQVRYRSGSA